MQGLLLVISIVGLVACARSEPSRRTAPPAEPVEADREPAPGEDPAPADATPTDAPSPDAGASGGGPTVDAAELYAACRDRVEGPEKAGECTTDADCVRAGCSSEVCLAAANAEGLMTTCEIRGCFQVLETCGCHDGVCSWSIKEGEVSPVPETNPSIQLPQ